MGSPRRSLAAATLSLAPLIIACGGSPAPRTPTTPSPPESPASPSPAPQPPPTWDVEARGVPPLVTSEYIDLEAVRRISRFRSGEGHSYHDDFESCRSMKHYFMPAPHLDWSTVAVRAPLAGELVDLRQEWAGMQLAIRSREYPAFTVILFHVTPSGPLAVGTTFASGERIGTHVGNQTWSDVAIRVDTGAGMRLVSFFEAMTPEVFERHRTRGVPAREAAIISRAERDANPLACAGDGAFTSRGTLAHWVDLR